MDRPLDYRKQLDAVLVPANPVVLTQAELRERAGEPFQPRLARETVPPAPRRGVHVGTGPLAA